MRFLGEHPAFRLRRASGTLLALLALGSLLWVFAGLRRGEAQLQHQPGAVCSSCHGDFRAGGTVFAATAAVSGQPSVPVSLLAADGSLMSLPSTNSSGNFYSRTVPDGSYLVLVGNLRSRTWHEIPAQGMCNSCHVKNGNAGADRPVKFPSAHTSIPSDNRCSHCHHFPAGFAYPQLATAGVLTPGSPPAPLPASKVVIAGKDYPFDPFAHDIQTVRPDVFAPGFYSMFDVILAVARKNGIALEYHWDADRKTHFITRMNGVAADYWYRFSYDTGSAGGNQAELNFRRANRWDEILWRPGVWIQLVTGEDLNAIKNAYLAEIQRERSQGNVIPTVRFELNPAQFRGNPVGSGRIPVNLEFRNVKVTAHDTRARNTAAHYSRPFQPGVVTSYDILLSLRDQGHLDLVSSVFYTYFAGNYIDSHYVVAVGFPGLGTAHNSGRQGLTYTTENGTPSNIPNGADAKLHLTSDIHVIHAPDFSRWRWTQLGNPHYESSPPDEPAVSHPLYFPALVQNSTALTGVALVNPGHRSSDVVLTAYRNSGAPAAGHNPVRVFVPAGSQLTRMVSQLFGMGFALDGGWIEAVSEQPGLAGFYLAMDPQLAAADGTDVSGRRLADFVFPEVRDTEISLVNPQSGGSADVSLQHVDDLGRAQGVPVLRQIAARGRIAARAADLFPSSAAGGYIRAAASTGLVAVQAFGEPNSAMAAAGAADTAGGSTQLYAPQFVFGGGYSSSAAVLNLGDETTVVTAAWRDDKGNPIGGPVVRELPPQGRLVLADAALFGISPGPAAIGGYLSVSSSRTRIAGIVRFGGISGAAFEAALPLLTTGKREAVFAQVAQDKTWFTGLAVANAGSGEANVEIAVYNADGGRVGSGKRVLKAGERISELLSQVIPGAGSMSQGFFRVSSNVPVLSFAVFGTHRLTALCAIPPQAWH